MISKLIFITSLILVIPAHAADIPLEFESPAQEQRYMDLIEELRCLVCQNQNLADSHADLAQDLREEVQRMILIGNSDSEIKEFMVARYGDFVLYRPPLKQSTWLLWGAPFLLLFTGFIILYRYTAGRRREPVLELSESQRAQLQAILDGDKPD